MANICLNMIVKNESKILPVLFESLKDFIDYYVIVDTGSTDGTQELIPKIMDKYGIKGEVYEEEWVSFGVNRQQALEKAVGKTKYILIIDADEELVYNKNFDFTKLDKSHYGIKRKLGSIEYYLPALINIGDNNKLGWYWKYPVHNILFAANCSTGRTDFSMKDIFIKSKMHTGAKSHGVTPYEKYSRDAELLLEYHLKHPKDARVVFYLGRSYDDAGRPKEAIEWYNKRVEMGGWPEEVYYSLLRIALCKLALDKKNKTDTFEKEIVYDFLKAHNYRPTRLEALYHVVKYYRIRNAKKGYIYGLLATDCLKFPTDILFVDTNIHAYMFADEFAVCAYHASDHKLAIKLNNFIISQKEAGKINIDLTRIKKNLGFSKQKL